MVAGSIAGGRRVAHSLAAKVTRIDHLEGFLANIVTAGVVIARAGGGLPMSTTYVALSAIVGAGARARRGSKDRRCLLREFGALRVVREIGGA